MTRCVITCCEPGCSNPIHYDSEDDEVPLYCSRHRTDYGRHSETRDLHPPVKPEPKPPNAIYRCTSTKCHKRKLVSKADWIEGVPVICECGKRMIYHKMENE